MTATPINLDAMTSDELRALVNTDTGNGWYHTYAMDILESRRYRERGEIVKALRYEEQAEATYNRMPPYLRW